MTPRASAWVSLLAFGWLSVTAASAGDLIFEDGFESGDVSAWALAVGYAPVATAFRVSDLDLRNPHVFFEIGLCFDFTRPVAGVRDLLQRCPRGRDYARQRRRWLPRPQRPDAVPALGSARRRGAF